MPLKWPDDGRKLGLLWEALAKSNGVCLLDGRQALLFVRPWEGRVWDSVRPFAVIRSFESGPKCFRRHREIALRAPEIVKWETDWSSPNCELVISIKATPPFRVQLMTPAALEYLFNPEGTEPNGNPRSASVTPCPVIHALN